MHQTLEIQNKFSLIQQSIMAASKACMDAKDTSPELKACMDKLGKQSALAKQAMQSDDEAKVVSMVDQLESLGDEAERACGKDSRAPQDVKAAVSKVHTDLSKLKQQLH